MLRSTLRGLALVAAATVVASCGSKSPSARAASDSVAQQASASSPASSNHAQVSLATAPDNDCDWIPVSEVESIVGKLAEPPREDEGGCVYTLPIPEHVLDERAKFAALRAKIAKLPGADSVMFNRSARPEPYGLLLEVNIKDMGIGAAALKSASSILASWAKDPNDTTGAADTAAKSRDSLRTALNGWDHRDSHGGRIGHIRILVRKLASDVDLAGDKLDTLAVRVRDRIPDLPFPMTGYSATDTDHDPCALLTRQEAEAVLGKLVIPPYRTGGDTPFAFADGPSCGYFTAGHHVLVVTPHWRRGKFDVAANNAIGGLVRAVSGDQEGQSADTLEGPWDQAAMSLDGRLVLLKDDRSLDMAFRGSSTDEIGALKLARIALPRLAAAKE